MREIKFRAYTGENLGMIYSDSIGLKRFFDMAMYHGFIDKVEQYTCLKDTNDVEAWEGDLRLYHGKIYKLVDDGWRFRLERNLVQFGENEDITVNEDVIFESELVGNIHQNKDLLLDKKE